MLTLLLAGCAQYKVYSVRERPTMTVGGGVMYALPKTLLRVDVTVERRDLSTATYSDYASEMLGVVPQAVDSSYRIVDIDVRGVNVADPDNYYFVKVNRGSVSVDEHHLLLAIGMEPEGGKRVERPTGGSNAEATMPLKAQYNLYDRADTLYTRYDRPGQPSLVSVRKDVRSMKQRAQAAAERLEELQTKKAELMAGEYEGTYSAEAVRYLYEQLCRQEEEVVADFCGTVRRETVSFYVEPRLKKGADFCDTVIWFSPATGFVGNEDDVQAGAFPVVCQVVSDGELRGASRFVKYHTSASGRRGERTGTAQGGKNFRYRVPERAEVTVFASDFSVRRNVTLSQLGPTVTLPKRRIKALFDPETLDLKLLER